MGMGMGTGTVGRSVEARIAAAALHTRLLHVFGALWREPVARAVATVLRRTADGELLAARAAYMRAFVGLSAAGWTGDGWRAQLAETITLEANAFTAGADAGPGLRAAASQDLALLEGLTDAGLWGAVRHRLGATGVEALPWEALGNRRPSGLTARLYASSGWPALAADLATHAQRGGAGPFARHLAYRWRPATAWRPGTVVPIADPDPAPLEALVGYTAQREALLANTERLLAGGPALDVLLYGDRGTGKSSSVKGLLARFGSRGLRLVELGRRDLPDLPDLLARLASARQRFIVFVDDLSFEEQETEYKDAKAALQGGIGARPRHVVVYATSNRRHLVRERLSERPDARGEDDPRAGDAVEEKLSLADRFGLTLVFARPDQELYLQIVDGLAAQRGIDLPTPLLHERALRWAAWYNGRSGRSARQFIDTLDPGASNATGDPAAKERDAAGTAGEARLAPGI